MKHRNRPTIYGPVQWPTHARTRPSLWTDARPSTVEMMRAARARKEPIMLQRYIVAAYDDRAPRIRFFVVLAPDAIAASNEVNTRRQYRHIETLTEQEWYEITNRCHADMVAE